MNNFAEVEIRYVSKPETVDNPIRIGCSRDVEKYIRGVFPSTDHLEYVLLLLLNRSNIVLGYNILSKGGISGSIIDIRIILQTALLANASGIVLIHNHPSGNLNPSEPDKAITKKVKDAAKLMDIGLLDHLIITSNQYLSFADENLL